jgi:signal transduction histidine kinase
MDGRSGNKLAAVPALAQDETIDDARQQPYRIGTVARGPQITTDGVAESLRTLNHRSAALETRNRELTGEVKQLRAECGHRRTWAATLGNVPQVQPSQPAQARTSFVREDERRRLERDLHDGVQNELVALIVKLRLAEEDPDTPPGLAGTLSALAARAQSALDSVRQIAHGIYPAVLADFGVAEALRAQAGRASMDVSLVGAAPRSTELAEAAVYFSCLEAIQNVAKHAGREAQVTLRLQHEHGTLAVRIEDDGRGFDPLHTPDGAGLRNIHDRIQTLGGTVKLTSSPGRGTVLTISLPWPPRTAEDRSDRPASSAVAPTSMTLAGMAPRSSSSCTPCPVPPLRRPAGPADRSRADDGPGQRDPRHRAGVAEGQVARRAEPFDLRS